MHDMEWRGPEGRLGRWLEDFSRNTLSAYRTKPELVEEHDNLERNTVESGYGRKQLNELAQNAADAMEETTGRLSFILTADALYCANEGSPLGTEGLTALLMSHSSQKRDDKIGRFGLGFKSVLRLTDTPEIISRTVSLRWNRARAAQEISAIVPNRATYPVLRLAEAFDPIPLADQDPVIKELMEWATTIVRLPLSNPAPWLAEEFDNFPVRFALFSRQIATLDLDNRRDGRRRTWIASRTPHGDGFGERVILASAGSEVAWDVFRLPHRPSQAALAEAGSIAARSELEVQWAVPLKDRARFVGEVWSYFPTESRTTLSGIINAAFKMNEDRRHLQDESTYNQEILAGTLPKIVAFALPRLIDPKDPGSFLEILPARGREARSWADRIINEPVMAAVAAMQFVPDRAGNPHFARDLEIEPDFDEEAETIRRLWNQSVGEDRPWAHPSLTRSIARNATLNRLLTRASKERSSITRWLEEVVYPKTLASYAAALEIAVWINKRHSLETQKGMRAAYIVPSGDGYLQRPIASAIFVPGDGDDKGPNLVSLDFVAHPGVRELLRQLDIGLLDSEGQLKKTIALLRSAPDRVEALESFWALSRSVELPAVLPMLASLPGGTIRVKCEDGEWRPATDVWLRGGLFAKDGLDDSSLVVDSAFHASDRRLLQSLKVRTNLPEPVQVSTGELYKLWKQAQIKAIEDEYRDKPNPVAGIHLTFKPVFATPGLERLTAASPGVRKAATEAILAQRHYIASVHVSNQYVPDIKVPDPDLWWARTFGAVDTPLGTVDVPHTVGHVEGIPDGFLPVPRVPQVAGGGDAASLLNLPTDARKLPWRYIYGLANSVLPATQLHQLYGIAALRGLPKPQKVRVETKYGPTELPIETAVVAADKGTYDYFAKNREAAVLYTEPAELKDALLDQWGLDEIRVRFETTLRHTEAEAPTTLIKRIPFVTEGVKGLSKVVVVPCSELYLEHTNDAGDPPQRSEQQAVLQDTTFYFRAELAPRVWLQHLLTKTGRTVPARTVLESAAAAEKRYKQAEKLRRVQSKQTDEERLLALVGEEAIRRLIPNHVFELIDSRLKDVELSGTELVKLASMLHGANLLQKMKPYLEEQGFEGPQQFKGSAEARKFVTSLGISEDFAGQASDPRKPGREEAVGPVLLSPMHDYQSDVSKQIKALLSGQARSRAIVQLPTGAGKTRVAVQSIVEHVGTVAGRSLVVWIADTEELCEQAVEAWLYVWQGAGVPGERMAVSRMWDGRRPKPEETRLHVVVATIQTLSRMAEEQAASYEWLFDADILVVDEAHGAIARSYTEVFRKFGRTNAERGKPLLGLSATPYRGVNEEETKRLVSRFDGQLLMPSQFSTENAHAYLQNMGVLARVRHEALDGIELKLTPGAVRPDGRDTAMLETRIDLDAVAKSQTRNDVILDHVFGVAQGATALVFAASVKHAEALAAALTREGVHSAAISSKTSSADRRRQIEDFRAGKIRVLTNFDVLSQGFDAPKVGAVYVCRPTFAPNKYLQMIGRGLRGPKNGGSEEVLIVNVEDNIENFGHKLAFNHFEYLWNTDS